MGEAKRRGTFEQRRTQGQRRVNDLSKKMFGGSGSHPELEARIRVGMRLFIDRMQAQEWETRRERIVAALRQRTNVKSDRGAGLAATASLRIKEDEIAWYLYLCEVAVDAPMCIEISQAQRCVPFIACLGAKAHLAPRIGGFDRKIDELLTNYKANPDGVIFELLVALGYAEKGWEVQFLDESSERSPDFRAKRSDRELYVECKRLSRRTDYSERERNTFLAMWDLASPELARNRQWIWLHGTFHVEIDTLPQTFIQDLLQRELPLRRQEKILLDDGQATIKARLIDKGKVEAHLENFMVKDFSPMLQSLLGGDWAPEDSQVSMLYEAHHRVATACEVPGLARYVDKLAMAAGMTRVFDAPQSIERKARDITKVLSQAVLQVPKDAESVIHIACETMEGAAVEERRTEKVLEKVQSFVSDKPVAEVRFHRIHAHSRADLFFEIDERIDRFRPEWAPLDRNIPNQVCTGPDSVAIPSAPWD